MATNVEKKRICVIGGGASGLALLWCLTSQDLSNSVVELTLLHDEPIVGGHSRTEYPTFNKVEYPVDIGVQYICPLLYGNTYRMLALPEFEKVTLTAGDIKLSAAFGPDMNWGNFPAYQSGPRFEKLYTQQNQDAARDFVNAIVLALPERRFAETVGDFLAKANLSQDFVDYFLMPYLSILNGYGDDQQLLDAAFEDLFPIFTHLLTPGPLAAFVQPGLGWERFTDGSSTWVQAMASSAIGRGATVLTGCRATAVWPDPDGAGAWVSWDTTMSPAATAQRFDAVVLTTDMNTNCTLLDNSKNPYFNSSSQPVTQEKFIGKDVFQLNPGSCYIHQDANVLAPWLRDQQEVVQFTAPYPPVATGPLPYDMSNAYSTYIVKNMVAGLPEPVYVSMYGQSVPPNPPAEDTWLMPPIQWWHGRFLGSMLVGVKRNLHNIQGLGNIWFAGNNTTQDSEEGALVSAMVIAGKLCPQWNYPFVGVSKADAAATFWYELMKDEFMFPSTSGGKIDYFAAMVARLSHLPEQ
jgi:hypothetical protein